MTQRAELARLGNHEAAAGGVAVGRHELADFIDQVGNAIVRTLTGKNLIRLQRYGRVEPAEPPRRESVRARANPLGQHVGKRAVSARIHLPAWIPTQYPCCRWRQNRSVANCDAHIVGVGRQPSTNCRLTEAGRSIVRKKLSR